MSAGETDSLQHEASKIQLSQVSYETSATLSWDIGVPTPTISLKIKHFLIIHREWGRQYLISINSDKKILNKSSQSQLYLQNEGLVDILLIFSLIMESYFKASCIIYTRWCLCLENCLSSMRKKWQHSTMKENWQLLPSCSVITSFHIFKYVLRN